MAGFRYALLATLLLAGGCWNLDSPCDPLCPSGSRCSRGQCLPDDAGPPDAGPPVTVDGGRTVWAKKFGGSGQEEDPVLALTNKKDRLLMGGNTRTNAMGRNDGVVMSLDLASGSPSWSASFGGAHFDRVKDLFMAPDGDVWVTGQFNVTATFDGATLSSNGLDDIFLLALDGATGKRRWVKGYGHKDSDGGLALVPRPGGGAYLAGQFQGTVHVGGNPLYSQGYSDAFLATYTAGGAHLWSRSWGGSEGDEAKDMVLAADGSIYITGAFRQTVDFGDRKPRASAGEADVFLLRLDGEGKVKWVRTFGSPKNDGGNTLALDGKGTVYLGGEFGGAFSAGGKQLTYAKDRDGFVAAFTAQGHHRWSISFGAVNEDKVTCMQVNELGHLLVGGFFGGEITLAGLRLTSADKADGFVAALDNNGRLRWARRLGGTGDDRVTGLLTVPGGEVVVAGDFKESMPTGKDGVQLISSGDMDFFLFRLTR